MIRVGAVLLIGALLASSSPMDSVFLITDSEPLDFDCTVLQERPSHVTVIDGDSLVRFDRSSIHHIERAAAQPSQPGKSRPPTQRIADWKSIVTNLARRSWATDIRQIPATVIDVGPLKFVPYKSHLISERFEVNVYGDPEDPAGFEMGAYGASARDAGMQSICLSFVLDALPLMADDQVVQGLPRTGGLAEREGVTFEITPPDAPDAYGGWWISVYDTAKLDRARAGDKEVEEISQPVSNIVEAPEVPEAPKAPEKQSTPPVQPKPAQARQPTSTIDPQAWRPADITQIKKTAAPTVNSGSSSSGRVYVRGYYRKDGTYVRPHSRKRSRR